MWARGEFNHLTILTEPPYLLDCSHLAPKHGETKGYQEVWRGTETPMGGTCPTGRSSACRGASAPSSRHRAGRNA